jgi:protein-disulfide isomerase
MANVSVDKLVLAFSVIISALIISGSIFFAVGSLNTSISGLQLAGGGGTAVAAPSAPTPSPTPAVAAPTAPTPAPAGNFAIKDLIDNAVFTEGDPNAPVVIVEYSDFECPFCKRAYGDAVVQIRENYIDTGKVLLVYKDFPLSFHPLAHPVAEMVRCAAEQGNEFGVELHDKVFTLATLNAANVNAAAAEIGLNMTQYNDCVDTGKYSQAVTDSFNSGAQQGVSGTPSFFIGKADGTAQLIVGAQPYSSFVPVIDGLLG